MGAGVALILANAFFVAMEFALTRLPQLDRRESDAGGVKLGWKMTERLEIHLTGCQVGISLSTILLGVVTEPAVTGLLTPAFEAIGLSQRYSWVSMAVTILVLNLAHKIWGEQAPTYFGVERPRQILTYLARPFEGWVKLTYPLIILGDKLAKATLKLFGVEVTRSWTEDEQPRGDLRRQLIELLERGGVSRDRRQEVVSSLDIGDLPVSDVMVGRAEIVALRQGETLDQTLDLIGRQPHSRYPLVDGDVDHFLGGVYTPELMANIRQLQNEQMGLSDLARQALKVKPDLTVSEFIDRCQESHQEIALVVDDERTVGLITLTDALEVIVGQVEDPLDLERQPGR